MLGTGSKISPRLDCVLPLRDPSEHQCTLVTVKGYVLYQGVKEGQQQRSGTCSTFTAGQEVTALRYLLSLHGGTGSLLESS